MIPQGLGTSHPVTGASFKKGKEDEDPCENLLFSFL